MNDYERKLEKLISSDDKEAIESFLQSMSSKANLRAAFLALVRKTENYSVLPLLESILPCSDQREFYPIYADAVSNGSISRIEEFFPNPLSAQEVSTACGLNDVDFYLIPGYFWDGWIYFESLIQSDNLELFLKFQPLFGWHMTNIISVASKHCAKRIITNCGFSTKNILRCVMHSIGAENKETLLFLRNELRDDEIADEAFEHGFLQFLTWNGSARRYPFIVDCFNSRIITLSDEGWNELKRLNGKLYDMVQNDV